MGTRRRIKKLLKRHAEEYSALVLVQHTVAKALLEALDTFQGTSRLIASAASLRDELNQHAGETAQAQDEHTESEILP